MTSEPVVLPETTLLDVEDAKEELRSVLRSHRRSRHRHRKNGHDPVCGSLTEHALEALDGARTVTAYVSVGCEPCTRPLLNRLEKRGVTVLLPVLGPRLSRSWGVFHGADDLAERAPGRPPEPGGAALPAEAVARADALVIPALAVDRGGRRLGQGGGWYDRMLPLRRDGVRVFAMVYDDELVPGPLQTQTHDETVDAVITSDAWFLLKGSAFASGR